MERNGTEHNWVIIESRRYDLKALTCIWEGRREISTGIYRRGVYLMPKAKRVIVWTESIWEDRFTHGCVGDKYHIASDDEIANLATQIEDSRLVELVPIAEGGT